MKLNWIQIVCIAILSISVIAGLALMITDYFFSGDYLLDAGIMTTLIGGVIPTIKLIYDYTNGKMKE